MTAKIWPAPPAVQQARSAPRCASAGFRDATGELLISKSKVSEITDPIWQDYQAFITRALSFGLRARAGSINTPQWAASSVRTGGI